VLSDTYSRVELNACFPAVDMFVPFRALGTYGL
jgi:hypothetical protein